MINNNSQNLKKLKNKPLVLFLSILAGSCFGLLVYIYHFQLPLFSKTNFAICLLLILATSLLVALFLYRFILPIYKQLTKKQHVFLMAISLISTMLGIFYIEHTIPHIYPIYPNHELEITIDMREASSDMDRVSFSHMKLAYRDVSYSEFDIEGLYEINENSIAFPSGQVVSMTWQGIVGEKAELVFYPTTEPANIKISWDGNLSQLELYQSDGNMASLIQDFQPVSAEILIIRLLTLPLIFFIIFSLLSGLFSPHPYASIMLIVWLLVYLIYWPGIIGSVNITAVNELWEGHPTNWHPLTYTLLVAFCMKYLGSASSVLILQIVSLAFIFASAFSYLQNKGVSKRVLTILSLLIAFLPSNFLSAISLTNDILYSIALLALAFLSLKIYETKGEWLDNKRNIFLLSLIASLSILFRYNGIPAIGFFFLCLFLFYPHKWRMSFISAGLVILSWFIINGPVSNALNVANETEGHLDNIILHHISAHVANGTPLSPEESTYLDQLLPLEEWQYDCCTNSAMWANEDFDLDTFHAQSTYNRQLALSLFLRNPGTELRHMLCASDIVWNVVDCCDIKRPNVAEIDGQYYWSRSYFPEYTEQSMLPVLLAPISSLLIQLNNLPLFSSLFWHPAWFLYAAIICTAILIHREKNLRVSLPISALFGQSLFLLLVNRVQNFRYQYCAVLIGFFLIAVVFDKTRKK